MTRTLLRHDVVGDEAESLFRGRVRKLARLCGWLDFYTDDSVGSRPGEFDLRLYRPPRVIHAELKSQHGRLSPWQREAKAVYEQCPGLEVYVWKPSDWTSIVETLT